MTKTCSPSKRRSATRASSGEVLNRLAEYVPNLFGGSADLAPSNKTDMKGKRRLLRGDAATAITCTLACASMRWRPSATASTLHGGLRPYCATFFVFTDYMKNAMRMSAMMKLAVPYVLTHDSIGVGEDGPTHQPIEHLAGLRAIPGLIVFRPADSKETAAGWIAALTEQASRGAGAHAPEPAAVRQERSGCAQGRLHHFRQRKGDAPMCMLMASGSEVEQCVRRAEAAQGRGR